MFPLEDDDPAGLGLDPAYVLPVRLQWWAERDPDRIFMQEVTGRTATYGHFMHLVRQWATRLGELGVQQGDRVISLIPTSIDASALWLAAGCMGAVEVPVNRELSGSFLAHALRDPGGTLCFVRPEDHLLPSTVDVPGLRTVVVERDGSFTAGAVPSELVWPEPADASCVIYTSGTTGPSKGVIISWAQMTATIGRIPRSWLSERDAVYSYHPFFHVTGRSPLPAMSDVGGRIVLREKLSVAEFWHDIRRFGCTSTTVNTALALAVPEQPDDADNPLRIALTGGNRSSARRFAERFGVEMLEAYGSTEMGFPIMNRHVAADPSRSCGSLRRGYEARIVDDEGADIPDGTPGEIWIRPPARPLITTGYLGRPDLTAAAIVDGWYHTGDRMIRWPDGRFEFVDRMKDTIRRLGENISATALEAAIMEDTDIADCAAVGVPDPVAGQEILAAVILRPGIVRSPADVHARLRDRLPRYMVPRFVVVADELPRTATNKIRKTSLTDVFGPADIWDARAR